MSAGNFGAIPTPSGEVEFRFWAPDCAHVDLVLNGQTIPMSGREGIFTVVAPAAFGAVYHYLLPGGQTVPDPASRAQAGGPHDDSLVITPDFRWKNQNWRGRPWHETIVYELHPGCFGGFNGIAGQLPRLAALGVTAIELMPVAEFPGRHNWGYDGVLPYAPASAYGTPDQLKALIDKAHGLGLQMFLDVVYNHFGPDGNYLNLYAKSFFQSDVHTPWGGAIDFDNPHVRRFFIENALYWLTDYKFDGLRFDAVHAIANTQFLHEMAVEIRSRTAGRHVHLILENEHNDAALLREIPDGPGYDAQWTDDWHHCLHVLLTRESEGYYEDFQNPAELLARCLEQGFAYQGEPSPHAGGAPRGSPSAHLPSTAFVICLQNHDQIGNRAFGERLRSLAHPQALNAAAALLLLTPQIPMLFMGEEWGETSPFLFFTDHNPELGEAVREGRRKEFAKFNAFADPEQRAKIPDPNAPSTFEASVIQPLPAPSPAQAQALKLHTRLLALRRDHIIPRLPGTVSLGAMPLNGAGIRAAWRLGDGARLIIAANFGAQNVACPHSSGVLLIRTAEPVLEPDTIPPYACFAWMEAA